MMDAIAKRVSYDIGCMKSLPETARQSLHPFHGYDDTVHERPLWEWSKP